MGADGARDPGSLEFRVLGPLEVWRDGRRLGVAGERQRALLALLLIHANEFVTSERLSEELFSSTGPEGAAPSLRVAISRLRRLLDDGEGDEEASVLVTRPKGYLLTVGAGRLDVANFERLVEDGRRTLAADPVKAAVTIRDALALWRGDPFADLSTLDFLQPEIRRLQELRIQALMDRFDADLVIGGSAGVIPEIEAQIALNPFQERLRGQLMLALYRAGRQADALARYRSASELFRDELGLEPGVALRELERAILNHDPSLEWQAASPAEPRPVIAWARATAVPGAPAPRVGRSSTGARRRRQGLLAIAAVVAAAVASAVSLIQSSGGSVLAASNGVVAIDPASAKAVAQINLGGRPSQIEVAPNDVWVLDADDGTVSGIDPRTRRVTNPVATSVTPTDLAAGAGSLYIGDRGTGSAAKYTSLPFGVTRYVPQLGGDTFTAVLPHQSIAAYSGGPPGSSHLSVAGRFLWAIAPDLNVVQIDRGTGRAIRRLAVQATSLAVGDGELWALDADQTDVVRLDLRSGAVVERISVPSFFPLSSLAVGGGYVWAASPLAGAISRLDPGAPSNVLSLPVGFGAFVVAYGYGDLWIGNDVTDTVSRLNPSTSAVTATVRVPSPQAIAIGDGLVWAGAGSLSGESGPLTEPDCGQPVGPAKPDVRIVSDFALEGNFSLYTIPAERAIMNVLSLARFRAGHFSVGYQACDDGTPLAGTSDASRCIANAADYAVDLSIVAVIGPSDSGCATSQIAVSSRAPKGPLAFISPFATEPILSRHMVGLPASLLAANYPHGTGNFLRTVGDDPVEIAADALLARQLRLHRVAVLFNRDGFTSQTQAQWFAYSSRRLRGAKALPILVPPGASAPSVLSALRRDRADGLLIAGSDLPPPLIVAVLTAARARFGSGFPIMMTEDYWPWWMLVGVARAAADGVYAAFTGYVLPSELPAAGRAAVAAAHGPAWAVANTAAATQAVLAAIATSNGTRRSVLHALEALRLPHSAVGALAFNKAGELVSAPVTIFRIRRGAHNASGVHDFQDATVEGVITPPQSALPPL